VRTTENEDGTGAVLDRDKAEELVKKGTLSVAVVLPKALAPRADSSIAMSRRRRCSCWPTSRIDCATDGAGPAPKVSFTAAPDLLANEGIGMLESAAAADAGAEIVDGRFKNCWRRRGRAPKTRRQRRPCD
jgi:hypothetical protein